MATKAKAKAKRAALISPVGEANWVHIWKPQINKENPEQEPKFSITLVFSKKTKIDYLEKALRLAAIAKFGAKAKSMLASGKLQLPIRDGDEETDEDDKPKYKGKWFIVAKSTQRPGVVDQDREPIEDQFDLYSGCKVRLSLYPFAYDIKGNKGVTFMLNNVQKIADGERKSGRANAEDDFDDGEDYSSDEDTDDEDDEDEAPVRGKKSKSKPSRSRDEDDEDEDEVDEDEDEDDEDEPPPRSKSKTKRSRVTDEDEDDEDEDLDDEEEEEPAPRRRRR